MMSEVISRLERIESLLQAYSSESLKADRPLPLKEAAEYMDVSESHLYHLTSRGAIPHFKPSGKRVYFRKSDLREYLLRNRVPPPPERA